MHVAICDDEKEELLHLQSLVKEFDSSVDISAFQSAESLLDNISKQAFDIVLLDIEMGEMNGFTAATKLAKMHNPPLIIFVTKSGEYTLRGYDVAIGYLPKPVDFKILAKVLARAVEKIKPQKFTISVDGCSCVIPINDIIYFEASGHRLIVHAIRTDYNCRMKLSEAETMLPGHIFASPHKSYLVNLDFVDRIGDNELTLARGVKVPISRRRKQEFERALFRFVRKLR